MDQGQPLIEDIFSWPYGSGRLLAGAKGQQIFKILKETPKERDAFMNNRGNKR